MKTVRVVLHAQVMPNEGQGFADCVREMIDAVRRVASGYVECEGRYYQFTFDHGKVIMSPGDSTCPL